MRNLISIVSVILIGCSSSQNKLIRDAEGFLKSTLDDPQSYQPESFIITDTTKSLEFERIITDSYLLYIESTIRTKKAFKPDIRDDTDYQKNIDRYNIELDSLIKIKENLLLRRDSLNEVPDSLDFIKYIYLLASFRTKDTCGSIIKNKTRILFSYKEKTFKILEGPDY